MTPHDHPSWDTWVARGLTEGQMLVEMVKQHATEHYTDGGWDVIVECFEDDELAEAIAPASTLEEAITNLEPVVSVWADRQADALNSVF